MAPERAPRRTSRLEAAAKALAINPRLATALLTKGALLLLSARAARAPEERRERAKQAKEALSAALRENPLLMRERQPALMEVEALAAGRP